MKVQLYERVNSKRFSFLKQELSVKVLCVCLNEGREGGLSMILKSILTHPRENDLGGRAGT